MRDAASSRSAKPSKREHGPVSERLAAATQRLEARGDELVRRILDAALGVPDYAAIEDPVIWDEVRQHTAASVPIYYEALRNGVMPSNRTMRVAHYSAKRRVEQGNVSLRALRTVYIVGMGILWRALMDEVQDDPELRDELLQRTLWAIPYHDLVTAGVSDAFYEEQEGRSRYRDQLTRDLFDEIIDGDPAATEVLETRAHRVGLDVEAEYRAVVIQWSSDVVGGGTTFDGLPPFPVVVACAESAGVPVERVVAVRRGSELLFVTPWQESKDSIRGLRKALPEAVARLVDAAVAVSVGVSGRGVGARCLRSAYHECTRAIELGGLVEAKSSVHFYDDYVLHDLIDSAPEQGDRLIAQTLAPLLEQGEGGERLIETLDAYLRSGHNHKVTAATLDIHRNTLAYRLQQIGRLTQLDLEDPADRLRVEAALRCLELRRRRDAKR